MKVGTKTVTALKLGEVNISRAYLGSTLVWEASGGEPTPAYHDDFETHDAATGIPSGWQLGSQSATPTWSVIGAPNPNIITGSRTLASDGGGTGESTIVMTGSSLTNGVITARVKAIAGAGNNNAQPAVVARFVDANNHLQLRASAFTDRRGLYLIQRDGGAETIWSTFFAVALGTVYRLELTLVGTSAVGNLYDSSEALLATVSGTVSLTGAGAVGVAHIGVNATMAYDDFAAT